jgi:hypothetical protein
MQDPGLLLPPSSLFACRGSRQLPSSCAAGAWRRSTHLSSNTAERGTDRLTLEERFMPLRRARPGGAVRGDCTAADELPSRAALSPVGGVSIV